VHIPPVVLACITGNIYATPGGVFSQRMLRQILDVLGPDRIMFAVDDPYKSTLGQQGKDPSRPHSRRGFARAFIETAPISAKDKSKLAHLNLERLLLARA
jgi:predicted TIM-barrel fold metal-dependent hydrolase